jgi:UDP-N-acetylglucosamine 2-epimerase
VPVHPNPAAHEPAIRILGGHPRVHLLDPLPYPDLVAALANARGVLTDSGGIQEEAPTFGTPILVLREVSERPEVLETGLARLVGTDPVKIKEGTREMLGRSPEDRDRARRENPYGDGKAADRIASVVDQFFGGVGGRPTAPTHSA